MMNYDSSSLCMLEVHFHRVTRTNVYAICLAWRVPVHNGGRLCNALKPE
jgi:hypothetical protein